MTFIATLKEADRCLIHVDFEQNFVLWDLPYQMVVPAPRGKSLCGKNGVPLSLFLTPKTGPENGLNFGTANMYQ